MLFWHCNNFWRNIVISFFLTSEQMPRSSLSFLLFAELHVGCWAPPLSTCTKGLFCSTVSTSGWVLSYRGSEWLRNLILYRKAWVLQLGFPRISNFLNRPCPQVKHIFFLFFSFKHYLSRSELAHWRITMIQTLPNMCIIAHKTCKLLHCWITSLPWLRKVPCTLIERDCDPLKSSSLRTPALEGLINIHHTLILICLPTSSRFLYPLIITVFISSATFPEGLGQFMAAEVSGVSVLAYHFMPHWFTRWV